MQSLQVRGGPGEIWSLPHGSFLSSREEDNAWQEVLQAAGLSVSLKHTEGVVTSGPLHLLLAHLILSLDFLRAGSLSLTWSPSTHLSSRGLLWVTPVKAAMLLASTAFCYIHSTYLLKVLLSIACTFLRCLPP